MSELPQGWAETTLTELCRTIASGRRPKGGVRGINEGVLSLGGEHVGSNGKVDLSTPRFIPHAFAANISGAKIEANDILVVKDGATTGKVALADAHFEATEAYVNEHVFLCRAVSGVEPNFLFSFLRSKEGREAILSDFRGAAQGGISRQFSNKIKVFVPPSAEQQRIVAKIESLTDRSKRARDHLDHLPLLVERYKQSVLAAAFNGRLTKLNSNQLSLVELGSLLQLGPQNGLYLPKDRYGSGTPILRIQNYSLDSVDDINTWSCVDVLQGMATQYGLITGDLVINRVNSPSHLGKSMVVLPDMEGALFESNMMRLRLCPGIEPRFLQLYLSSPGGRANLTKGAKWAVNQASINQGDVTSTIVPLPNHDAQVEILRRISTAFNWIDRLAADATSARKLIDHLDQVVLAKAFRGELVPQDPADEPASVLLDRIRAERAAAPKQKRGRKMAA